VNEFLADPINFKAENLPPKKVITQKAVLQITGDEGVRNLAEQFSVQRRITRNTLF
jgi:hypothetical protein